MQATLPQVLSAPPENLRVDHLVIGSGPGGSLTACMLAEAGREVLVVEEGPFLPLESCPPFSREEMIQKYRNGGLTVAMGQPKVSYVEGRCVGGGSEINSGLYHRPPPEILEEWRQGFQVEALTEKDLEPHSAVIERDISVSYLPGVAPPASLRLHQGAQALGWRSLEVPRWFAHTPSGGTRQSMTRTYIPRALAAGARLLPQTRALKLRRRSGCWQVQLAWQGDAGERRFSVEAKVVVVACGAIQTPTLLRRSGLGRHAGRTLHLHPTIKVVARFPEPINFAGMGVPVHQVKEFAPRYSFGCSISAPPHLALALLDNPAHVAEVEQDWPRLAIYYAMSRGGKGSVATLPWYRDPLVRYRLNSADLTELAEALRQLCRCLFAGGADRLIPSIAQVGAFQSEGDLAQLPEQLPASKSSLMTIHLFSSCPMGENRQRCVANSFGKVHGEEDLYLADASLLPGPPGVNPQGSILAVARRNVCRYLGRDG